MVAGESLVLIVSKEGGTNFSTDLLNCVFFCLVLSFLPLVVPFPNTIFFSKPFFSLPSFCFFFGRVGVGKNGKNEIKNKY